MLKENAERKNKSENRQEKETTFWVEIKRLVKEGEIMIIRPLSGKFCRKYRYQVICVSKA